MSRDQPDEKFEFEGIPKYPAMDREKVVNAFDQVRADLDEKFEILNSDVPGPISPVDDQIKHVHEVGKVLGGLEAIENLSKLVFEQ